MEGTAVNTLLACMENYNEAVKKMTAKLRPGDGLWPGPQTGPLPHGVL